MIRTVLALCLTALAVAGPAEARHRRAHAQEAVADRNGALLLEVGSDRVLAARGAVTQVVISVAGVVTADAPSARTVRLMGASPGRTDVTLVTSRGSRTYPVEVTEKGGLESRKLQAQLAQQPGLQAVQVSKPGEKFVLSGTVPDVDAGARAEAAAAAYAGGPVSNQTQVNGRQMVAVDVRFIAVSDTTLKSLGFNFSDLGQGISWAVVGPNTLNSFSADSTGLKVDASAPLQNAFNLLLHDRKQGVLGVLSALSDAGLSHVLAQPTLMVRSGEKADFLAGGEVPIPVPQAGGTAGAITIEYRPYGVRLSVEPFVMADNRIVLKLAPEVSELDDSNRITLQGFSIPAFRRRSANTTVELGDGQSFVIAGLTYATSSSNESKVPGLGELPVIGALFKTAQQTREKLELVIVATPRLVSPLDPRDVADLAAAPAQPDPSIADIILNNHPTEQRAARVGLSR